MGKTAIDNNCDYEQMDFQKKKKILETIYKDTY